MPIKSRIRTIPDHPKPGIQFRDISTLLQDRDAADLERLVRTLEEEERRVEGRELRALLARSLVLGALSLLDHRTPLAPRRWRRPFRRAASPISDRFRLPA